MFGQNRGMRLSGKGLGITAQQIVGVGNEIFYLNGGLVLSKRYDSTKDAGFSDTDTATRMVAEIDTQYSPIGSIVEIAGGETLKVRYDNGLGYECSVVGANIIAIEKGNHIARVTKNGWYSPANANISGSGTFIIDFYKSGAGDAPLVPYLSGGGFDDVVSIFEGENEDHFIRVGEVNVGEIPVGFVGGLTIIQNGSSKYLRTPTGDVLIDGFGTIMRDTDPIISIKMVSHIATNGNTHVDYSDQFSPSHYAYIEANRIDRVSGWAGVGNTGYVVDLGNTPIMTVPINGGVSTVGGTPTVPTVALNESIPFVVKDGELRRVSASGLGDALDVITDNGLALIQKLYTNDMSQKVVLGSNTGGNDIEPFSINGYCFGYGDNHYVDAVFQPI